MNLRKRGPALFRIGAVTCTLVLACGGRTEGLFEKSIRGAANGGSAADSGSGGSVASGAAPAMGGQLSIGGAGSSSGGTLVVGSGADAGAPALGSGGTSVSSAGSGGTVSPVAGAGGVAASDGGSAGQEASGGAGGAPPVSNCCSEHAGTACDDASVVDCVCHGTSMWGGDSFCCTAHWDDQCAYEVTLFACGECPH